MNKYNKNKLIKFDIFYKIVSAAVFYPLLLVILKVTLKLSGIQYLTNEYIFKFVTKPATILGFFLVFLMLLLMINLEQQFIFAGFERLKTEKMRIAYVIDNGFSGMKNAIKPQNIVSLLLTGIIVLTLNLSVVYNITVNLVNVRTYVTEGLRKSVNVRYAIAGVFVWMLFITVIGIFTSCIMYDKKTCFIRAFAESFRLSMKNLGKIVFYVMVYNIAVMAVVIMLYTVISAVVIAGVNVLDLNKAGAAIYLTVIRYFSIFMNVVLSLVSIPATGFFISWLYQKYAGKMQGKRIDREKSYHSVVKYVIVAACILDVFYVYSAIHDNHFKQIDFLRSIEITAHRGSCISLPENTMAAFEQAAEDLTDYIEIDVRQTADGKFVIMHDENLKRTTGINAKVGELTQEQICSLNAGRDTEGVFPGVTVPSLEEVLEFAKRKLIRLNIELKTASTDKNYARELYKLLQEYGMAGTCVITSSDYKILKEMKELDENIETGYILSMAVGNFYDMEDVDFFSVNYRFVTTTMIYVMHSMGKDIHIWTLNDESDILRYVNMGADNIITDDPILAREVIYSKDAPDIFVYVLNYVFGN